MGYYLRKRLGIAVAWGWLLVLPRLGHPYLLKYLLEWGKQRVHQNLNDN
jgi:hypothetical protein